jgi:MarR family transcriptional regulator, organic hydroperoxide resistance regulator
MDTLYWLKRSHLAARKALDELLIPFGITAAQLDVLKFLWEQDPLEQRTLQEKMGVTGATLSHLITELVERGLIERRAYEEDSRVNQIGLTEKGRLLNRELDAVRLQFREKYTEGFAQTELALLTDWLKKLSNNLNS